MNKKKGSEMENQHGGDIYGNHVKYDFSTNINPLGMPEESYEAAVKSLKQSVHYPEIYGRKLCEELSRAEGISVNHILLGNGAAELIYALCFALRPRRTLGVAPSFSEYESAVKASGGEMVFHCLEESEEFVLNDTILEQLTSDIDLCFLCNPNNPTGRTVNLDLMHKIGHICEERGIFWCVDECFLPFWEEEERYSLKSKLEEYPHLFVLRAFTKICGMPGLRLGYGMSANKELLQRIRTCMQPWNTSLPAQAAGRAALTVKGYLEKTREYIRKEKEWLIRSMEELGNVKVFPTEANFILFRARTDLGEKLLERGILIRDCSNFKGLKEGYFRIGVRTHAENEELIRALQDILE